jgi:Recombination endonuclease VII
VVSVGELFGSLFGPPSMPSMPPESVRWCELCGATVALRSQSVQQVPNLAMLPKGVRYVGPVRDELVWRVQDWSYRDHCHECGAQRGRVCPGCNTALVTVEYDGGRTAVRGRHRGLDPMWRLAARVYLVRTDPCGLAPKPRPRPAGCDCGCWS